jgi:purine-nucleoside phosphorylase
MDIADILFIAADPMEFAGPMESWRNVQVLQLPVHWARTAYWKKKRIVAIANGAGPHRSAEAAHACPHKTLVNIGFCGAVDPRLKVGDIVVGDWWLQPKSSRPYISGGIASLDHIAQTAEEKRELRQGGYIAVDMEIAGLEGRPCYCIKAVTDLASETFANDLNAVLQPDGKMNITQLLLFALLRPLSRIPELKRLQRRAQIASNSLGDFLDTCTF